MKRTAIIILSDPKTGSQEALGRVFNALGVAYDCKTSGEEVVIFFQGTGTRWPEVLQKESHPVHTLYKAVEDKIKGVSSGCADVFGANASGFDLIKENQVPGTSGLPSFVNLQKEGFTIITF
jgi:predicted peroxiredoxin